jgi:hypothetical protein
MLKRPNPTLSPNRFKSSEIKNLFETIQNVSNRSLLNEFGIAGGPESSTNDALMNWKPKKRSLGGLEIPGSDEDVEGTEGTEESGTSSSGFGSGTATETPKLTGPQSTALGGKSTGFKTKTGSASGFRLGSTSPDMATVKSALGSRAGKFADVGGKPNQGMDYGAGLYYMVSQPMLIAGAAGGAAALSKAAETVGSSASGVEKILGSATTALGATKAGELANALGNEMAEPTKYLTKKPALKAPPKLR